MAVTGKEKEQKKEYKKYVGMFTARVVSVNPTKEELSKLLGTTIEKDPEYMGMNSETDAKKLTLSFWLREENIGNLFNVRFNLEDTVVVSKSGKTQFINNIGNTSYATDISLVPSFLTDNGRTLRPAKKGEELLYKFLKSWLSNLNYSDESTDLSLDWKKLISGKVIEIEEAMDTYSKQTVCAMATIRTADDGKEYQAVYSYDFLSTFAINYFTGKSNKNYPIIDKFISKVNDIDYGCKDYYELTPLKEYNPADNVVNRTSSVIINEEVALETLVIDTDLPF